MKLLVLIFLVVGFSPKFLLAFQFSHHLSKGYRNNLQLQAKRLLGEHFDSSIISNSQSVKSTVNRRISKAANSMIIIGSLLKVQTADAAGEY